MPFVERTRRGPVTLLTLNRPERLNSFDKPAIVELRQAAEAVAQDREARCVLLTGAGKGFCAGADLAAAQGLDQEQTRAYFAHLTLHYHAALRAFARMDKPLVAAVNGVAAGGGLGLALAGDLRLGSEAARFKAAYMTLGVSPDGGSTWTLPRIVGEAKAKEMFYLDEPVGAPDAVRLGLLTRVVEGPKLLDEGLALAARLAAGPRQAQGRLRRLLAASPTASLEEQLRAERRWTTASSTTAEFREGAAAFAAKRPPRFP
jgi:2-(1,2-epoxy-1,2-dihydrophenyl)acetyl-CoA isomerase